MQASYFLLWLDNEPSIGEVQRVLRSLCAGLAERFRRCSPARCRRPTNDRDDDQDDGDRSGHGATDTPAGKEGNAGQRGQDQERGTADSLTARDLDDRVFDDLLDELGDDLARRRRAAGRSEPRSRQHYCTVPRQGGG
ncbi:MAG: hypothetical protein M5U09_22295 [Gammaproteobacteria bacterium]|nr:hypothetical protein [Gammaproteobacteria bacterium]